MPLNYFVQDEPILDKQKAEGHAVRLLYLAVAVSKVGRLLGDQKMLDTAERLWDNIVKHRMYITGAVGSCQVGESFSFDDDLPNDLVYGETCASVAMMFYGKSLMETKPRGSVADVMEQELFNGVLSGEQLDGTRYFYVNPLEADPEASKGNPTKHHILTRRAGWFDCACCPANLGRLIASLDQYLYTVSDDGKTVYAHQFVANKTEFEDDFTIEQTQTGDEYPWSGDITFHVSNPNGLNKKVAVRIPQWSKDYTLEVNGKPADLPVADGFVTVDASAAETEIHLVLDMSVRRVRASLRVRADIGKLAVARGPIVFCMEQVDNEGPLWLDGMSADAEVSEAYEPDLLEGVEVLKVKGSRLESPSDDQYQNVAEPLAEREETLTMIPYYAWCNREEGQMQVWIRETK